MSKEVCSSKEACSSSSNASQSEELDADDELVTRVSGGGSGWVKPKTSCEHLSSLASDLSHFPVPDTSCFRCNHPVENWLCLCCKDVLCSRFVNRHMLEHYKQKGHCLALSYSDLSVWCFDCDAYLNAQVIDQLRVAHETAYLLKFGERPPVTEAECVISEGTEAESVISEGTEAECVVSEGTEADSLSSEK